MAATARRMEDGGSMRVRRCIVTGDVLAEARLVRFATDGEGCVVPDIAAKLPGRGLWVCATREAIAEAAKKNLFARAAHAPLLAASNLAERTEALLVAQMLGRIGLARKAGELILGFDQVERALRAARPPAVLIEAAEAAADGRRKLQAASASRGVAPFVIGALNREELGLALGRENVVHAALKSGRMAERLVFDAERLAGFRPLRVWVWSGYSATDAGARGAAKPRDATFSGRLDA